ncbi:MAG: helix-turn-helix transcriptional regulator [Nitrospinae bacterium]|nr:helix-turn-helix transcriptional regulator [Nitrospinota bacterium]
MKNNFFYNRSFTSLIPFVDDISGKRINGLEGAGIQFSSKNLGWDGVVVEKGVQHGWDATDFSVSGHYLAINLSNVSLSFERKTPHGFKREVMPPGTLWLNPTGETFTHRVKQVCTYGAIVLDSDKFERLAGILKTELRLHYSLQDPQLEYLVRALLLEAQNGGMNGRIFSDSLTAALSVYIASHFSAADNRPCQMRGGIPRIKLRSLLDFIETYISTDIRLEDIAALVNLSPYHFAREFKRTVGLSPHQYILSRKIDRAKELLGENKRSVAEIAYELGFADQSHLTRLFKRQVGITPAEYARLRKR